MVSVAVVLPGAGYAAERPLLHWPAAMLRQAGWHIVTVRWDDPMPEEAELTAMIERRVSDEFASATGEVAASEFTRRMIVAKSVGTRALPWALANGIPGIWLTPVLTHPAIAAALRDAGPEHLAVGGDADALWLPESLAGARAAMMTVPGANHSLEIPGDWKGSVAAQDLVFARVASHLDL